MPSKLSRFLWYPSRPVCSPHSEPGNLFAKLNGYVWIGSANGMSINLLGLEEGFDIPLAVLNTIKGKSNIQVAYLWDID
jgi:hypothetical protein